MEKSVSSNISRTVEGTSGSVKMEDASSSKAENAPYLTTLSVVEGGASKMEHTLDESVAKPVICSSEEMTADVLTVETDSSPVSQRDTSNMEKTLEKSVDSGSTSKNITVDESCVLAKSEVVPESLEKKTHEITTEDTKPLGKFSKEFNQINAKFRRIARTFCEERNIPLPNQYNFKSIIRDLLKDQKLDEKNLEIKLEEAALQKLKTSADPIEIGTWKEKIIGDEVSDTKKKGEQSISFWSDVEPESPKKSISEEELVRREVEAKYQKCRSIGVTYCKSKNIGVPCRKRFNEIMSELARKQQLNVEELKAALDVHGWLLREEALWNGAKRVKPRLDANGEIIPSIKKITEMTMEERIAFFEQFKALRVTMKAIAIKHCHTIKAPFPIIKWFNSMCRDLYEDGMLDEENIKLLIERDFEERCNRPLNDEQTYFILKRFCADTGYRVIGLQSMKAEILQKIPKKLLCQKHLWHLMYREQKTNLFLVDELNLKAAKKGTPEDSIPSCVAKNDRPEDSESSNAASRVKKNDVKTGGVAVELKSKQTNEEPITPHGNKMSKSLHAMGLPWSNKKLNPLNASSSGATQNATSSSYTNTSSQRLDEEPIQQLVVQTQECIAEQARMLGGVGSQESIVSQSLPSRVQSHWDRSNMCWEKNQEQRGKGMNLQAQSYVAGEKFPKPLGKRDHSQSQPWGRGARNVPDFIPSDTIIPSTQSYSPDQNFSGQNLMIANFGYDTNISGAFEGQGSSSAQRAWQNELHMENRGFNCAGMSKDYSRNSGFGENSRNQGTRFGGHSEGCDYEAPVVGTSERAWSESNRFSPPRKNKTNWDDLGRENNKLNRDSELLEANLRPPPIISALTTKPAFRNSQEQSCRNKDDDDWQFVREAPRQKKSRFGEDRRPQSCQSVDLQRVVSESKSRFAEDDRMSSETFNPSTSGWRSWGQASPRRIGDQSLNEQNLMAAKRGHASSTGKKNDAKTSGAVAEPKWKQTNQEPISQAQSSLAGERFPKPLGKPVHSQSQPWNFSGQNLMIANFASDTNSRGAFGGQGSSSAQPAWQNEPHMENRGLNSVGMPKDDYSRNSGFGENSGHQGTRFGGRDYEVPVVGTSERGWSERSRFSRPRKNNSNWDDLGRGNNKPKRVSELSEANLRPPPIISNPTIKPALNQHSNSQKQSCQNKYADDWRFVRGAPPLKKSRFDEDRQP